MIANPTPPGQNMSSMQMILRRMRNAAMPTAQLGQPQGGMDQSDRARQFALNGPQGAAAGPMNPPDPNAPPGTGQPGPSIAAPPRLGGFSGPSATAAQMAFNAAGGANSLPPAVAADVAAGKMSAEQAFQRVMQNRPEFAQRAIGAINGGSMEPPQAQPQPGIATALTGLRAAVGDRGNQGQAGGGYQRPGRGGMNDYQLSGSQMPQPDAQAPTNAAPPEANQGGQGAMNKVFQSSLRRMPRRLQY